MESRFAGDFDAEVLDIFIKVAKTAKEPLPNLVRAVADVSQYYHDIEYHIQAFQELLNYILANISLILQGTPESQDPSQQGQALSREFFNLANVIIQCTIESSRKAEELDQSDLNAACLCAQLVIHYLHMHARGTDLIGTLLVKTADLLKAVKLASDSYIYCRIYGIFCSAFIYMPIESISFLVNQNSFEELHKQLVNHSNNFTTTYDRRLFVLSMISVFREKLKQAQVDDIAIASLDNAILGLHVQRMEEDMKLAAGENMAGRKTGKEN